MVEGMENNDTNSSNNDTNSSNNDTNSSNNDTNSSNLGEKATSIIFLKDGKTWEHTGGQVIVYVTPKGLKMLEEESCSLQDLFNAREVWGSVDAYLQD